MIRSRTAMLLVLAVLLAGSVLGYQVRYSPTPPTNITVSQNQTFMYDFNTTYLSNGSNVTENGVLVRYYMQATNYSNITLNQVNGRLVFRPNNGDVGNETVTYFVRNDSNETNEFRDIKFYVLNINDPPSIVAHAPASPTQTASENDTINLTLNATDPDLQYGDALHVEWYVSSINDTPNSSGVLVQNTSGTNAVLNYTIGFCQAGSMQVLAEAIDKHNTSASYQWNYTVANRNRNITFNGSIENQTYNQAYGLVANFSIWSVFRDPDELECGPLDSNYTFTTNGTHVNVTVNATSGQISFNSSRYWAGNETIVITGSDGASNATSNPFKVHVALVPVPPIAPNLTAQTAFAGARFTLDARFVDYDLPYGDNLSYSLNDTSLFNVSWHNASGNISYARISFVPTNAQAGNYSFDLTAMDTYNLSTSANFTLQVRRNDPPVMPAFSLPNATQGSNYAVAINASDPNGDTITFSTNSSLFGGTYNATIGGYPLPSINSTSALLNLTPTNAQVGNYSIEFVARDTHGALTNYTTNLTIENLNDPPTNLTPSGGTLRAKTDHLLTETVTVADPDFEWGDNVTVTANMSALNLTRMRANGSRWTLSWTPNASDEYRNYTVNLTATDRAGASMSSIVTIRVLPPLPPTITVPIANLTTQATSNYSTGILATDPNGDPLTFSINDSIWSSHASYNGSAAFISATYTGADVGTYPINITVKDPDNMTDSVVVNFTIQPFNLPPVLLDARNITFVRGNTSTYTFHVSDAENNTWAALFEAANLSWLTVTKLNATAFNLTATPNTSEVGFWPARLLLNQTTYPPRNNTYTINITVYDTLRAPQITQTNPAAGGVYNYSENSDHTFSARIDDPNFNTSDTVRYRWTFENKTVGQGQIRNGTTVTLPLHLDYCTAPGGTLNLTATDASNLSATKVWLLTIPNTNRAPYFGEKRFSSDVMRNAASLTYLNGSWTYAGVNVTASKLVQSVSGTNGTVTSPVIDFGIRNGDARARTNLTSVSVVGSGSVYVQLRFGSSPKTIDPSWTNWSAPVPAGSYPGNLSIQTYAQVRYVLAGAGGNRSAVTNSTIHYAFVANQTIKSDVSYQQYYYLDDYFTDPDYVQCGNEPINATVNGEFLLNVSIDPNTRAVGIFTTNVGQETLNFSYSDGQANATSNDITFTIEKNVDTNPIIVPSGGGGGGSSVTPVPIPVKIPEPVPKPLQIITPGTSTMYQNETLTVPITISNTWNSTLTNIHLSADSNNTNVSLKLGSTLIPSLASGTNRTFNLTVASYATYGQYAIKVHARVDDPVYNDTATVLINSIELGKKGNDTYNTKLTFARDLVQSNPRCLELNEQIQKAQGLVQSGSTQEAITLLGDIVSNCRYLLSLDNASLTGQVTSNAPWYRKAWDQTSTQSKVYVGAIVLVNGMLLVLVAAYLFAGRRGARKRAARAEEEPEETTSERRRRSGPL